jgi:hypothetical protein
LEYHPNADKVEIYEKRYRNYLKLGELQENSQRSSS